MIRMSEHLSCAALLAACALSVAGAATAAETTYRCERADGSIEYTHRPCEGDAGEAVELPEMNTFEGRPVVRPTEGAGDAEADPYDESGAEPEFGGYSVFEISDPTPEKLYVNIGGQLTVSVRISPRLQQGHGIMLYLDGQAVSMRPQNRTSFQLTEVWPVIHTVRAEVVNEEGGIEATSTDVQFFVRQRTQN
jgi:hypothetical protein